ncbi:MAG: hypothetical protein ACI9MR_000563, partial [Myxococcota bacterium]
MTDAHDVTAWVGGAQLLTSCPEPDGVLAFLSGELNGEALASFDMHLDTCPDCQMPLDSGAGAGGGGGGG